MAEKEINFEEWQKTVPETIKSEKFWTLIAYQKGLYLYQLLWNDTEAWRKDERGQVLSKQIIGSSDSICANIEEGFGRGLENSVFFSMSIPSALPAKQKDASIVQRNSISPKFSTGGSFSPVKL